MSFDLPLKLFYLIIIQAFIFHIIPCLDMLSSWKLRNANTPIFLLDEIENVLNYIIINNTLQYSTSGLYMKWRFEASIPEIPMYIPDLEI